MTARASEGTLLDEKPAPVDFWGPRFMAGAEGVVTVTADQAPSGMVMVQRLVAVTPEGSRSLYELPLELVMMQLPGINMPAPKVFAPSVTWTSHGGEVYVLNEPGYRMDRYVQGASVASFRRAVEPIRVTRTMAVASVEMGSGPNS